ncbi:hypothetical protein U1Q18_021980 [Sarracenia purpurea var. burkii]
MDVEIPNWLKGLPLAPEFHPTDTEFADPIAYISKIEKEASAFGICKVIPPLPKPSRKYVISNLSKSLLKCPELGVDINSEGICSSSKTDSRNEASDSEARAVFTTRHQELGQNAKATKKAVQPLSPGVRKQVWQSGEIYTLEQFESKSKAFARSQLGMAKELSPSVVEALFWKAAYEKPIHVEYANDVPGSGFGEHEGSFRYFHRRRKRRRRTFDRNSGGNYCSKKYQVDNTSNNSENNGKSTNNSLNCSRETTKVCISLPTILSNQTSEFSRQKGSNAANDMEGTAGWKLSNSPWNLQVIARSPGSLTRFMPDDIPGVTSPMIYIGMLFSWFAWHVEDHELHSLNFLHTGSPKTWYAVPGDYAFSFEEVIRHQAYGGNIDRLAALTLLGEKTTLLSPEVVVESGIPCCRLIQNPGEFVVTFPRAYHIGFSHGFNCGEAANFGTSKWLKVAKEAAVRRAAMNYLPMLSHQQLLYLLTMSFVSRVPRSLLPGARSSRLRDRQKEERELLVKKAFIEDILNENQLLTVLLGKNLTYHVVLWELESLPSPSKESDLSSSVSTVVTTPREVCHENKNDRDLFSEMSSYIETMNDLYADDDDLSCNFQVESGTLACVACGILGFPFMAVVQPSERASMDLLQDIALPKPVESHSPPVLDDSVEGFISDGLKGGEIERNDSNLLHQPNEACSSAKSIKCTVHLSEDQSSTFPDLSPPPKPLPVSSEVMFDKGWSATRGFLRPRIFCLEHAIQIEEMLHSKGGANVLVICHSDFQNIKAHTRAIAEEIGSPFEYNEIPLDDASHEDLNLIDLAIDDEEHDECGEDWTSKLGFNLRYCVKVRKNSPSKQVQHALALGGLFTNPIPNSNPSNLNWPSKKTRSKRNLNHRVHMKLFESIQLENPVQIKPSESIQMEMDEMPGTKPDGIVVRKEGKLIQYSRKNFKYKTTKHVQDRVSVADCEGPDERNMENISQNDLIGDSRLASTPCVESVKATRTVDNFLEKMIVEEEEVKASDSTTGDGSDLQHEIKFNESVVKNEKFCAEKSAGSLFIAVESTENSEMQRENITVEEISMINVASMNNNSEGKWSIQSDEDVLIKEVFDLLISSAPSCVNNSVMESLDGEREQTVVGKSYTKTEVVDFVVQQEIQSELKEKEPVLSKDQSTALSTEEILEVSIKTDSGDEMDSDRENHWSSDKNELENAISTTLCATSIVSNVSERRKVELQRELGLDVSCFTRSPCEGLRPRAMKEAKRGGIKSNEMCEEKPVAKKVRKKTLDEREKRKGSHSHRCDLEGCRMSFQTKLDLLLHKRNRCPQEGCRKKFSSHKYAILHQRVHDDDRPLKCPWKGCTMSFKWAWARTEHLRVHTGERPYQCKVEGCGLTFRFVSDYSRHRRKTGHYANQPT